MKRSIYLISLDHEYEEPPFRMPGTITVGTTAVADVIGTLPEGTLIGQMTQDGTELVPLDMDALYPHLPDRVITDDEGNVIGTEPALRHVPHNYSGWPQFEVTI